MTVAVVTMKPPRQSRSVKPWSLIFILHDGGEMVVTQAYAFRVDSATMNQADGTAHTGATHLRLYSLAIHARTIPHYARHISF